jgi:uncharacterized membrane protein
MIVFLGLSDYLIPSFKKKKIIWQILEKTFANFTWKFKEYLTLKFQEKNSVRKKKHSAPLKKQVLVDRLTFQNSAYNF